MRRCNPMLHSRQLSAGYPFDACLTLEQSKTSCLGARSTTIRMKTIPSYMGEVPSRNVF